MVWGLMVITFKGLRIYVLGYLGVYLLVGKGLSFMGLGVKGFIINDYGVHNTWVKDLGIKKFRVRGLRE